MGGVNNFKHVCFNDFFLITGYQKQANQSRVINYICALMVNRHYYPQNNCNNNREYLWFGQVKYK